ncbi:hypothetical protein CISG_09698 [Coccidioides immitis RMSCC 3703]|uniref:Uncharacterized protein n=1 Tax=Coccidioides immitis RMSCC 3703 TaxID=454286 RepID=A0A0J8QKD7_COCIT|nr:hypothetical protein CISG_09698 [Coccidioides immitis RMSCC 3703]
MSTPVCRQKKREKKATFNPEQPRAIQPGTSYSSAWRTPALAFIPYSISILFRFLNPLRHGAARLPRSHAVDTLAPNRSRPKERRKVVLSKKSTFNVTGPRHYG